MEGGHWHNCVAHRAGCGRSVRFSSGVHALTDKDTVVLADFANATGDPVFDGTLRQALAIQLEQSPFLKIMDDEQVQQNLRLMSLTPGARITNQIAHDICVRGAAAVVISATRASSYFPLTARFLHSHYNRQYSYLVKN